MRANVCLLFALIYLLTPSLYSQNATTTDPTAQLQNLIKRLQQIEAASYVSTLESYAPGDTTPSLSTQFLAKEFPNPVDTFVGASYVMLSSEDTSQMQYGYDGHMSAQVYPEEKVIVIDSFQHNPLPFRPIRAPFFTRVTRLLQYILETTDSLAINSQITDNTLQYRFTIYDQVVEIIGNRVIYPPPLYGTHEGEISQYDLWIDLTTRLPFRLKREMPHNTSVETCEQVRFPGTNSKAFQLKNYFPDLPLMTKGSRQLPISTLREKAAPDWQLSDTEGKSWSLAEVESKVILLQFTSVSCGPCLLSVSFLKQLRSEYDEGDVTLIAIESFNDNAQVLDRYRQRHDFAYPFLLADKATTARYEIAAVPVFYLLDQDRVIRKVIRGYRKDSTDQEIRAAITSMLR